MPSPFPGMDPYVESSGLWRDFHVGMIGAVRAELNARLPDGYAASSEVHVWFHEPKARDRVRQRPVAPDVYVKEAATAGAKEGGRKLRRGAVPVASPSGEVVLPGVEHRKHRFIQVRDSRAGRVVTVIEILSPDNKKAGDGREAYLAKRNESFANRLNFVEIDLLRGGRRLPLGDRPPAVADYYVMVCRAWNWPRADFWTFSLRDRLPTVPVPLAPGVPDVPLPLRTCVNRAYDEGRYRSELPYGEPLTPRLREQDEAWVKQILTGRRAKGGR